MYKFISAVTALAVTITLASITAITPVFAQQDPNSHGLEVSGVAEGQGVDVSGIVVAGKLPGGACIVSELAQTQGEDVSAVASDLPIDTSR